MNIGRNQKIFGIFSIAVAVFFAPAHASAQSLSDTLDVISDSLKKTSNFSQKITEKANGVVARIAETNISKITSPIISPIESGLAAAKSGYASAKTGYVAAVAGASDIANQSASAWTGGVNQTLSSVYGYVVGKTSDLFSLFYIKNTFTAANVTASSSVAASGTASVTSSVVSKNTVIKKTQTNSAGAATGAGEVSTSIAGNTGTGALTSIINSLLGRVSALESAPRTNVTNVMNNYSGSGASGSYSAPSVLSYSAPTISASSFSNIADSVGRVLESFKTNTMIPSINGAISDAVSNGTIGGSGTSTVSSQWTTSGSDVYYSSGNVGVGTTTPSARLGVAGDALITGNVTAAAFYGDGSNLTGISAGASTSSVRAMFSSTVPGIAYSTSTGILSLDPSYNIPLAASSSALWASSSAFSDFYATPSSRITAGAGLTWTGSTLANSGVLSIGGLTGNVSTSSLGIAGSQWITSGSDIFYSAGNVDISGQTLIGDGDRTSQSSFPLYISDSSNLGWKVADGSGTSKFELYAGFGGTNEMRLLNGVKLIGYGQNLTLGTDQNGSAFTILNNANGTASFAGNVGIGTSNPSGNLEIQDSGYGGSIVLKNSVTTSGSSISLDAQKNLYVMNYDPSYLFLGANGASAIFIAPSGNVGIGNYPAYLFDLGSAHIAADGSASFANGSTTIDASGNIATGGSVTAAAFYGDGSNLTGITSFSTSTTRGVFSNTATGLTYDNSTGITSLTSGYNIPLTASTTEWASTVASIASLNASTTNLSTFYQTPSTRITAGTGLAWSGNTINSTGVTSIGGFTGAVATSSFSTSDFTEGSNLYFTNGRADARANIQIGLATSTIQAMTANSVATSTIRNMFSNTVTGLTFSSGTGITSLTSGYVIPLTASTTEWANKVSSQWLTSGANISYSAGNVGIGTTGPQGKLDVAGQTLIGNGDRTAQSTYPLYISDSSNLGWKVADGSGISKFELYAGFGGTNEMRLLNGVSLIGYGQNLTLGTSQNGSAITILDNASGNVGIGTTAPSEKLHVVGGRILAGPAPTTQTSSSIKILSTDTSDAYFGAALTTGETAFLEAYNGQAGLDAYKFAASSGGIPLNIGGFNGGGNTTNLRFWTAGSERMDILNNGNVGIGTTTPATALSVVGAGNFTSDLTTRGVLNVLGTGTSTVNSDILLSGDIVPSADNTYRLGTPSRMWKDVYIGPGSLYVNGQKVLQTDVSNNVTITADSNQNLVLKSAGTGDLELNPSGTGQILLKGNLRLSAGKTITTSDASPLVLTNGADLGSIRVTSNTISPTNLNGGITIAATGTGGVYFTQGNVGIATTSPAYPLTVSGDINFTGALRANGDAGTAGYVLLSNGSSAPTWVATSTLGISGGGGSLSGGTNGYLARWTSASTLSSGLLIDNGTVAGVNATSSSYTFNVQGSAATNPFNVASSSGVSLFTVLANGNVGIGTTTPGSSLVVQGSGAFTGKMTLPDTVSSSVGGIYFGSNQFLHNYGTRNTFTGSASGNFTLTGTDNTGNGINALGALTSGHSNAALGSNAGNGITSGVRNVAIGYYAIGGGGGSTGNDNVAIGYGVGSATSVTGAGNVGVGMYAIRTLSSGNYNVALGYGAGEAAGTAANNVFVGKAAGSLTTGSNNIMIGYQAGANLVTGTKNIIIGYDISATSSTMTNGLNIGNLIFGTGLDGSATTLSTGKIGIGSTTPYAKLTVAGEAYADLFTAGSTTATSTFAGGLNVGNGALTYNWATGLTNIANASLGAMTFDSDSGMVSWVDMPVTSTSASGTVQSYTAQLDGNPMLSIYGLSDGAGAVNTLRVGVGTTTPVSTFAVAGTINASNLVGGASLSADASGNIILTPSDERLKQDIKPIESALDKLMKLQGVTFDWKDKERFGSSTEIGFIAQDVQKIVPEVIRQGPEYMSLNYSNMVALVVEAVKELKTRVDAVLGWFSPSGDRINIKGMVCVDDVCVTKDQFKQMLMNSGSVMVIPQTSAPAPTTPTVSTTPDTSGSGDSSTSTSDATTTSSDVVPVPEATPTTESTPVSEPAPTPTPTTDSTSTDTPPVESAPTTDSPAQ